MQENRDNTNKQKNIIMDLTKFDLHGLQSLHIGYQNVLDNHKKQLDELRQDKNTPKIIIDALEQKINFFKYQITLIEQEINKINSTELRFSVEYLFWNFGFLKKTLQIHFLITSVAYKKYGEYVTGIVHFSKNEIPQLLENVKNGINNDGNIRFNEIVSDDMSKETKEKLKTEGFYASEITQIYYA